MVDWKKEYKLFGNRGSKPHPEDAGEAKVPWYKKEIGGGKRASKQAAVEEAAGEPKVPWYKKEIGGGKRAAVEAVVEAPEAPKAAKTPWYKKEISLKRGSEEEPAPAEAPEALPEPVGAVVPLPEPEPTPEPVVLPEPVAPEPEPVFLADSPLLSRESEPAPEPFVLPEPVAAVEPELPEPIPARPISWVDAVLQGAPTPPQPEPPAAEAPAEPEGASPEPFLEVEPIAAPEPPAPAPAIALPDPEPEPAPVALPEPEPVAPPVSAAAEALPEPDLRPVNPPVRAHELPPLDEEEVDEPQVAWYKRDLSRGRKRKRERPEAVDSPPKPTPFWKKELTFTRGAKVRPARAEKQQVVVPEAAPTPVAVEKPQSVPFWKKELGRKKPTAKPATAEAPVAAAEPKPKPPAEPFWKRGITMPTLALPQRGGGGGRGSVPKQLVGLKVGASQIAAARVSNNGHAEVQQVARQPLDQGVVVGGELRDPDALADALKAFFQRNKLPKRAVRLGIANNRIGVRTFDIAGIDDGKQLANAIRFRAQEALPIPIEEAVLDYQVLGETVNAEGEKVRKILLVVAYRELVDRYVAACRKAGITLVGIDLEAFALLRALAAPPEEGVKTNAALVAVAVGHDRSTFAVSDGRVCEFTRVLEWGGQNLSVAIARALDLSPSEADPIKHALSLSGGSTPEGLTDDQAAAAHDAVTRQVANFARELVSSLQFYQSQPDSLGIGEIVLTGGTAHLDGFADELQRVIGVKVRVGDPLVRVKVPKRFREPEQIGSLSVAIGLGIED